MSEFGTGADGPTSKPYAGCPNRIVIPAVGMFRLTVFVVVDRHPDSGVPLTVRMHEDDDHIDCLDPGQVLFMAYVPEALLQARTDEAMDQYRQRGEL